MYILFYQYKNGAIGRHKESDCWYELVAIARSEYDLCNGWYILDGKGQPIYSSQEEQS